MSEVGAEKADGAAAAGGGNKKLLAIVMAVNVLLGGGLAYVFVGAKTHPAETRKAHGRIHPDDAADAAGGHAEDAEEEEYEDEGKGTHERFGPILELGNFIVNLANAPGAPPRYAKLTLHLEALDEEAKTRVEKGKVPLQSEALLLLSSMKSEDLIGQPKILALAADLQKRCNRALGRRSVRKVYFSELVIQ